MYLFIVYIYIYIYVYAYYISNFTPPPSWGLGTSAESPSKLMRLCRDSRNTKKTKT